MTGTPSPFQGIVAALRTSNDLASASSLVALAIGRLQASMPKLCLESDDDDRDKAARRLTAFANEFTRAGALTGVACPQPSHEEKSYDVHPHGIGRVAVKAVRSMLFAPGNRSDLVAKAFDSAADAVIVDLEDAVPHALKAEARRALATLPPQVGPALYVRVNDEASGLLFADLVAAAQAGAVGIVLPKAESATVIAQMDGALTAMETQADLPIGQIDIVPLFESAAGVENAFAICAASPRVRSVLFGSGEQGDLVVDLGCEWTPEGTGLNYARARVLLAARAAGIEHPMDAVFMDHSNDEAMARECLLARTMGYTGKAAIHPRQLAIIHEIFTPSAEVVADQRRVLAAFEEAEANGSAAISVDGKMVDYAVARRARSVIARAGSGVDLPSSQSAGK